MTTYLENPIKKWWLPVLVGAFLIGGGFYMMTQPLAAFMGFALLFGAMIFSAGVLNAAFAIMNRKQFDHWIWYLMIGVFEIIIGVALLLQPDISQQSLILFTGFWLLFAAVSRMSFAFVLKKMNLKQWWVYLITAIAIALFAFLIIINPVFGILGVVYLITIPIVLTGIIAVYLGLQLRKLNKELF